MRDRGSAMLMLTLALMRAGRRDDAERQLAILVCEAEQSGLRMAIHNALLFRSALASASGRFADAKAVAAEAAQRAGRHTIIVELSYAAEIGEPLRHFVERRTHPAGVRKHDHGRPGTGGGVRCVQARIHRAIGSRDRDVASGHQRPPGVNGPDVATEHRPEVNRL